ncbi:hypothetical protein ACQKP0_24255 [Heyndrickxia sp. NPDC080065]|uniref:hypothetical protein n=1 Tax=Heyndrickxia sp. NPDC080065 TaxID=3390568 RepID=UPI003D029666
MTIVRDMTELSMMSITDWTNTEIKHFHYSFQQILPYLNAEGQTIYKDIVEEIERRSSH